MCVRPVPQTVVAARRVFIVLLFRHASVCVLFPLVLIIVLLCLDGVVLFPLLVFVLSATSHSGGNDTFLFFRFVFRRFFHFFSRSYNVNVCAVPVVSSAMT